MNINRALEVVADEMDAWTPTQRRIEFISEQADRLTEEADKQTPDPDVVMAAAVNTIDAVGMDSNITDGVLRLCNAARDSNN